MHICETDSTLSMTKTQEGNFQIGYSGVCSLVTPQLLLLTVTLRTGTKETLLT